jgi:hypothetical protein
MDRGSNEILFLLAGATQNLMSEHCVGTFLKLFRCCNDSTWFLPIRPKVQTEKLENNAKYAKEQNLKHLETNTSTPAKDKIQLPLAELLPTPTLVMWRVMNPNAKFKATCGERNSRLTLNAS